MSKPKITDEQLQKELDDGMSVPAIAEKYNMQPRGVRNKITKLHKKTRRTCLSILRKAAG
ncbi:MAG: hypothetical protein SOR93_03585 [Clostridiales Family XIII bacterium]|uniref:hypothetical protein n=1 Tax=Hominibacterium faecale TaxID=2839743 RepID=UPI0022B29C72|nr:hypothetical protein [Hominibacterium faecale]MCI7301852.1 hypothetical protein [Clostridia bacterium]MDY3010329.1 hypothetical protein [Clostridiales Family XIII bacterium]